MKKEACANKTCWSGIQTDTLRAEMDKIYYPIVYKTLEHFRGTAPLRANLTNASERLASDTRATRE